MLMIEFLSLTNAEQVRLLAETAPVYSRLDLLRNHYSREFDFYGLRVRQTIRIQDWQTTLAEVQEEETPSMLN